MPITHPTCHPPRSSRVPTRGPTAIGFTLLELLVVVAIIGLLAAYVGPKYFGQIGKSEQALVRAQLAGFEEALAHFRLDMGRFPTTEEGLQALRSPPASGAAVQGIAHWNGPYLSKPLPQDPWGHPYQYRQPGQVGDYDLLSWGKDGQAGGSGEAADISAE